MNWLKLESIEDLEKAISSSFISPVLIFKHSTRCSISSTALGRLQRQWTEVDIKPYYLDLLEYRSISNAIAEKLNVEHASPQAILIQNGIVFYEASHFEISFDEMCLATKEVA